MFIFSRCQLFLSFFFSLDHRFQCLVVPAAVLLLVCTSDTRPAASAEQSCRRLFVNKVQISFKHLLRFYSNIVQCFRTCQAAINPPEWFGVPPDWLRYYSGRNDSNNPWLSISNQTPHRPCHCSSLCADKLDNLSR